jgi:hypothetical protein
MRRARLGGLLLCAAFSASAQQAPAPRVFVTMRPDLVVAMRARVRAGDAAIQPALARLKHDADAALVAPIVAVTDKRTQMPPSGDTHDYYSLSPYWWPDSTKPGGLPYVRHDGVTNPESKRDLDQPRVAALGEHVSALALAYYLTGNEPYADRAARQLRAWFLDSATKMTPHLRFAQLVRGNPQERGSGIIDTRWFIEVVDAIGLLRGSHAWTQRDEDGMRQWMSAYLAWLLTSPNGQHEHDAKNNHGSWYAAQTASLAMFVGDTARARQIATDAKARIGWQITPAGDQPLELERTKSLHYSAFNVEALSRVAEIGRIAGVDIWKYEAPEGGSLKKAIDHLAKYAADPQAWPGQEISTVGLDEMVILMRRGEAAYGERRYETALSSLPSNVVRADRSALLYP